MLSSAVNNRNKSLCTRWQEQDVAVAVENEMNFIKRTTTRPLPLFNVGGTIKELEIGT